MGCEQHEGHTHKHGSGCGHPAIAHEGHTDYLHEGHLHNVHDGHVDEHRISSGGRNPASCTPSHQCTGHEVGHHHGPSCGHESIPHGDHDDFMVAGHLHHPHGGHCDDHGAFRGV
jgi:hypothetical protein